MLGLSGLLLPIRFLIPAFALAFILDLFLLFFMGAYVKKNYLLSAFSPDDSYKLNSRFEQLKAQYSFKKIQLLKPAKIDSACFYLSDLNGSLIVISENILESFSQEDIACFLSYAFQKIKSGDAGFLTVLSSFLFLWEKFFYGVSYPFIYFKQRKRKALDKSLKLPDSTKDYTRAENKDSSAYLNKPDQQQIFSNQMGMGLAFGILSLMTRNLFYNNDRLLYQNDSMWKNSNTAKLKERVRKQALFLWKLDSFLALNPPQLPLFFAPLFLTNFLTNLSKKDYIPLQPSIKNRVKKLVGGYPP